MTVAKLLEPTVPYPNPEVSAPSSTTTNTTTTNNTNGNNSSTKARFYGHNYLKNQSLIMLTLGINDTRVPVPPIQLNATSNGGTNSKQQPTTAGSATAIKSPNAVDLNTFSSLSLVVSAVNASGESAICDLPIREWTEPILFYVDESTNDQQSIGDGPDVLLQFDIVPTNSSRREVLARALSVVHGVGGKPPLVHPNNVGVAHTIIYI
jgi:glycerophosphodiester phosphodiesterase